MKEIGQVTYMKWKIVENYEELSAEAARLVAMQVKKKPDSVLGLATGSTCGRHVQGIGSYVSRRESGLFPDYHL